MEWIYTEKADRVLKVTERQMVPNRAFDVIRGIMFIGGFAGAMYTFYNSDNEVPFSRSVCFFLMIVTLLAGMIQIRKEQLFTVELRFYYDRIVIIRTDVRYYGEHRKEIRSYTYLDAPKVIYKRRKKRLIIDGMSYADTKPLKRTERATDQVGPFFPVMMSTKCILDLRMPDGMDIVKEIENSSPLKVVIMR